MRPLHHDLKSGVIEHVYFPEWSMTLILDLEIWRVALHKCCSMTQRNVHAERDLCIMT